MATNLDRYKNDLTKLVNRWEILLQAMQALVFPKEFDEAHRKAKLDPAEVRKALPEFGVGYQAWYSEAKSLIKQLLPDRLDDFVGHYEKPKSRKQITFESYRIVDALQGLTTKTNFGELIASPKAAVPHFQQQGNILKAVNARFESSLFDVRQLLQADLFDSELEACSELSKKGFVRAAGAMAGVVLEGHLKQVVDKHQIASRKSHPTISEFNDLLKNGSIIDVPEWRKIQRLGDLRNLCDHSKGREPTSDEIDELINGVEKLTKTLF